MRYIAPLFAATRLAALAIGRTANDDPCRRTAVVQRPLLDDSVRMLRTRLRRYARLPARLGSLGAQAAVSLSGCPESCPRQRQSVVAQRPAEGTLKWERVRDIELFRRSTSCYTQRQPLRGAGRQSGRGESRVSPLQITSKGQSRHRGQDPLQKNRRFPLRNA